MRDMMPFLEELEDRQMRRQVRWSGCKLIIALVMLFAVYSIAAMEPPVEWKFWPAHHQEVGK